MNGNCINLRMQHRQDFRVSVSHICIIVKIVASDTIKSIIDACLTNSSELNMELKKLLTPNKGMVLIRVIYFFWMFGEKVFNYLQLIFNYFLSQS